MLHDPITKFFRTLHKTQQVNKYLVLFTSVSASLEENEIHIVIDIGF